MVPLDRALGSRPVAKGGPGGSPQAIQGIVNTLFWLYCGFNFSESKIIVIQGGQAKVKPTYIFAGSI